MSSAKPVEPVPTELLRFQVVRLSIYHEKNQQTNLLMLKYIKLIKDNENIEQV